MSDTTFATFASVWDGTAAPSEAPPRPIAPAPPGAAAAWPPAPVERTAAAAARAFGNHELSARLSSALGEPGAAWRVRWAHDVDPGVLPAFVLAAGPRALVQGEGMWELVDASGGARVTTGLFDDGAITLDPERDLFYAAGTSGEIVARSLTRGAQAYYFTLTFGKQYQRRYIGRVEGRLVVVSVEVVLDPHAPGEPDTAMVESVPLPPQPEVDPADGSVSAPVAAHLFLPSRVLVAAMRGRAVVLATRGGLTYADSELRLRRQFSGDFTPVALSLDEVGRAYLLVDAGGRRALWVVTPAGERAAAVELPEEAQEASHPPVVGYDHAVYVLGADRVYAYAPDGTLRWQSAPGPEPKGASITADDRLLVALGSRVVAFAPGGEPTMLHDFPGEQLRTAPVMTAAGDLLVASRGKLFCLTRE